MSTDLRFRVLAVFAVIVFLVQPVGAQVLTGTILGKIIDPSGAVVPGVTVTATHVSTGLTAKSDSNDVGDYVLSNLKPGQYKLTAEREGFKREEISGITLLIDQRARIDMTLTLGETTESISINAEAPILDTESSSLGKVIENKTIVDLPLNGRNFMQLALLAPGVAPPMPGDARGTFFAADSENIVVANGMRGEFNTYLLDGVENGDTMFNALMFSPSVDAIQEFKIQTGQYTAEYGKGGGAVVNVAIKSGTKAFHGSLFEFLRNDKLDARNFFSRTKPPFRRNQFGGTLGGPIIKNRTFFFFNYEGLRTRQSFSGVGRVPNARERAGDFSSQATIFDPLTYDPVTNTRQPFPGNIIPANRIHPVSRKILDQYWPTPNNPSDPARNLLFNSSTINDFDQYTIRVDHHFDRYGDFFARYSNSDHYTERLGTGGAGALPGPVGCSCTIDTRRPQSVTLSHIKAFSPGLSNEFRFGFSRIASREGPPSQGTNFNKELGVPGFENEDPTTQHFLRMRVTGFATPNDFGITRLTPNIFQFVDNISHIRGNHNLKGGANIRRSQNNWFNSSQIAGGYFFDGRFTGRPNLAGNAMADFLLGYSNRNLINRQFDTIYSRATQYHFYLQDDWKVTSNLTLNLGIRYEYDTPWTEKQNRYASFDFQTGEYVFAKDAPVQRFLPLPIPFRFLDRNSIYLPDRNNWAPRIGFAYRLNQNRTVLRGGFGVFYISPIGNSRSDAGTPLPLARIVNILTGNIDPTLTFGFDPPKTQFTVADFQNSIFQILPLDFTNGYNQQWSFGIQQDLGRQMVVEVGYVGSKGTHLDLNLPENVGTPGPGAETNRRPFPFIGTLVTIGKPVGFSSYHALQARLEKRYSEGFYFLSSYTWSKSIDLFSTLNQLATNNPFDINADKGLSDFDRRHRLALSYLYELPFGQGKHYLSQGQVLGKIVGGWMLGGIWTFQTGQPFSPLNRTNQVNIFGVATRPNRTCNGNLPSSERTIDRWFDPSCFQTPAAFTFGNAGRTILTGPGSTVIDFSLTRNFRISESKRIEFRTEVFNLPNHANFGRPSSTIDLPTTGSITSTGTERQIQFGLKFLF